jgi:hypothetical protein
MFSFLQHFKSTSVTLNSHVHLISCLSFFHFTTFSEEIAPAVAIQLYTYHQTRTRLLQSARLHVDASAALTQFILI